ncbi:hypothetical protein U5801_18675 [Lamprobacter modestohalophilus]|uniref:hypothetical protein n=1 Tax=Lamprobacter modestohalophilus TaxID=1064514 RepID=UPI002ADEACB1|nr:hypothetical protein [Lamprobacter modestohalophilus]MEA1051812.1 hypothetical protein [Lamprobacter modestohalophilus]
MKQCLFLCLLCATLLAVGCSSQPTRVGAVAGSSGPEILLPDGGVEEAQLLAMGMARSKGWKIAEVGDQRVLLERKLPASSPQAQLLSPEGVLTRPKLQIETRLRERGNDVVVGLSSSVIVNPGTEQERRVDYTADYQDQLMISLNALASAWLENRTRIASEIPLPPDPDQIVIAEAGTVSNGGTAPPSSDTNRSALTMPVEPNTDGATMAAVATPIATPLATSLATSLATPPAPTPPLQTGDDAPREIQPIGSGVSAAQDLNAETTPTESNEMLVLDSQARRGLWTFYAEASARERGCAVGERGAVLLSTTTAFELYEVQCAGSPNLLLRCQGGVCRDIN